MQRGGGASSSSFAASVAGARRRRLPPATEGAPAPPPSRLLPLLPRLGAHLEQQHGRAGKGPSHPRVRQQKRPRRGRPQPLRERPNLLGARSPRFRRRGRREGGGGAAAGAAARG